MQLTFSAGGCLFAALARSKLFEDNSIVESWCGNYKTATDMAPEPVSLDEARRRKV